jgi:group I intron endonuclease
VSEELHVKMVVYLIYNIINGKYYVGRTKKTLAVRWKEHQSYPPEECYLLQRAIKKYGSDAFVVSVLTFCSSVEELVRVEQLWILSLRSYDRTVGYNMTYGGEGFGYGAFPEEERKVIARKIGNANRGKVRSPEYIQKMKGKVCSEEIKQRLRILRLGTKDSEATKKKKSESARAMLALHPEVKQQRAESRI